MWTVESFISQLHHPSPGDAQQLVGENLHETQKVLQKIDIRSSHLFPDQIELYEAAVTVRVGWMHVCTCVPFALGFLLVQVDLLSSTYSSLAVPRLILQELCLLVETRTSHLLSLALEAEFPNTLMKSAGSRCRLRDTDIPAICPYPKHYSTQFFVRIC